MEEKNFEQNNMQENKQGKLKINVVDEKKGAGRKDRNAEFL